MALNVDTASIESTAKVIDHLAAEATTYRDGLSIFTIRAGNFPAAQELKGKVEAGVESYRTFLTTVRNSLEAISADLKKAGSGYVATEKANQNAAESAPFSKAWETLGGVPPVRIPPVDGTGTQSNNAGSGGSSTKA